MHSSMIPINNIFRSVIIFKKMAKYYAKTSMQIRHFALMSNLPTHLTNIPKMNILVFWYRGCMFWYKMIPRYCWIPIYQIPCFTAYWLYRVYHKKVNKYKMAYKSNMELNFRRSFCEYGDFKVF